MARISLPWGSQFLVAITQTSPLDSPANLRRMHPPNDDATPGQGKAPKRKQRLPEASDRSSAMENLASEEKQGLSSMPSKRKEGPRKIEDMDLEIESPDETPIISPKVKSTPREPEQASQVDLAKEEEPVSGYREAEPMSGNEEEEALRREGGRAKSVRPAEFEPAAWESSKTRLDVYEADESPAKVGAVIPASLQFLKEAGPN